MRFYLSALAFLLFSLHSRPLHAQGCSDAGVCTLNALKPKSEADHSTNHIKIGLTNGLADHGIQVFGTHFEFGRMFSKRFGVDAKLAALAQSGNDITVVGLSDLYLNGKFSPNERTGLVLGLKIPMTKAKRKYNAVPLPMDYQSSLGTLDLILAVSHKIGNISLAAAYQQPLTQNKNAFFAADYPIGSELHKIQTTNQFERRGDVLLRVSYPIVLGKKLTVTPSILPIYHLGNDQYFDGNKKRDIAGSDGFTLNGNVFLDFKLKKNKTFQISLASPFIVRDARPDGLTRGYVVGLEYGVSF